MALKQDHSNDLTIHGYRYPNFGLAVESGFQLDQQIVRKLQQQSPSATGITVAGPTLEDITRETLAALLRCHAMLDTLETGPEQPDAAKNLGQSGVFNITGESQKIANALASRIDTLVNRLGRL